MPIARFGQARRELPAVTTRIRFAIAIVSYLLGLVAFAG
jgi:hypothetical protein